MLRAYPWLLSFTPSACWPPAFCDRAARPKPKSLAHCAGAPEPSLKFCPAISGITRPGNFTKRRLARAFTGQLSPRRSPVSANMVGRRSNYRKALSLPSRAEYASARRRRASTSNASKCERKIRIASDCIDRCEQACSRQMVFRFHLGQNAPEAVMFRDYILDTRLALW